MPLHHAARAGSSETPRSVLPDPGFAGSAPPEPLVRIPPALAALGYDAGFAAAFAAAARFEDERVSRAVHDLVPARVACEHRGRYALASERGALSGTLTGRLRNLAGARAELPATGDWVLARRASREAPRAGAPGDDGTGLEAGEAGGEAAVVAVLPRRSQLARSASGGRAEAQVVAANLDVVFLVTSPNQDLNLRRVERYVAAVWEGGAVPVLVLNKADLVADPAPYLAELAAVATGVDAVAVSALGRDGLERIRERLGPGRTGAFVGSSGVGKSTLVNALTGDGDLETGPIRAKDDRGRHTTTRRELLFVPGGGGIVIDTPGLRGIEPWAADEAIGEVYADLEAVATGCRYRDCVHAGEPGCAVVAAIAAGRLDPGRLAGWQKVRREAAFQERKRNAVAATLERQRWKVIHKSQRQRPDKRR